MLEELCRNKHYVDAVTTPLRLGILFNRNNNCFFRNNCLCVNAVLIVLLPLYTHLIGIDRVVNFSDDEVDSPN